VTEVTRYGPGEAAPSFAPGDFLLTHSAGVVPAAIRLGEALRCHGRRKVYAHWSHAALVTGADGSLIEAGGHGVGRGNVSEYTPTEYHLVHIDATDADRVEMVDFAIACVGKPYGFVTIACIIMRIVTGLRWTFGVDGTYICSGLVAHALGRGTFIFAKDPDGMWPSDLAEAFAVIP